METPASNADPLQPAVEPAAGSEGADSPEKVVDELLRALMDRDGAKAWPMLSPADQAKVGFPQRLTEDAYASGWRGFRINSSSTDSVMVTIDQTPKVSDIDGVIAGTATMTVPVTKDGARYFASWSRRTVVQGYPERTPENDRDTIETVLDWATARQLCKTAPQEHIGGLIGVVGLATALCDATNTGAPPTRAVVLSIGDLDSLDEPQPVIDGFGASAFTWARVVALRTPVPMNVVVAPNGSSWTVIALARPSLSSP